MTRNGYFIRLGLSIAIDVFDFTLGRMPLFGSIGDGAGVLALLWMWGPVGLFSAWELADSPNWSTPSFPTATLIALSVGWKKGFIGKKAPAAPAEPRNVTPAPRQLP